MTIIPNELSDDNHQQDIPVTTVLALNHNDKEHKIHQDRNDNDNTNGQAPEPFIPTIELPPTLVINPVSGQAMERDESPTRTTEISNQNNGNNVNYDNENVIVVDAQPVHAVAQEQIPPRNNSPIKSTTTKPSSEARSHHQQQEQEQKQQRSDNCCCDVCWFPFYCDYNAQTSFCNCLFGFDCTGGCCSWCCGGDGNNELCHGCNEICCQNGCSLLMSDCQGCVACCESCCYGCGVCCTNCLAAT